MKALIVSFLVVLLALSAHSQTVAELLQGENLVSSNREFADEYVDDEGPDFMLIIEEIADRVGLIKDEVGGFCVPSHNFNNLGFWDTHKVYTFVMQESADLELHGELIPFDRPIQLNSGWNRIPYYPEHPMYVRDAFADLVESGLLLLVRDLRGGAYYPSFDWDGDWVLVPGKGYWVEVTEACEFTYPNNGDEDIDPRPGPNLQHFPDVPRTDYSISILINSITGIEVVDGAEIACFTPDGVIGGATVIEGLPCGMAAWRDDPNTLDVVEGFHDGEAIHLLYWDPVHDWELEMSVEILDGDELIFRGDLIAINVMLGVDEKDPATQPLDFSLDGIYPNPFNSTTRIEFSLQRRTDLHLTVYDLAGRRVVSLVDATLETGKHFATLNGDLLQSGIYLVALESGNRRQVKRALLIK